MTITKTCKRKTCGAAFQANEADRAIKMLCPACIEKANRAGAARQNRSLSSKRIDGTNQFSPR